jgi:hypothetical protein
MRLPAAFSRNPAAQRKNQIHGVCSDTTNLVLIPRASNQKAYFEGAGAGAEGIG